MPYLHNSGIETKLIHPGVFITTESKTFPLIMQTNIKLVHACSQFKVLYKFMCKLSAALRLLASCPCTPWKYRTWVAQNYSFFHWGLLHWLLLFCGLLGTWCLTLKCTFMFLSLHLGDPVNELFKFGGNILCSFFHLQDFLLSSLQTFICKWLCEQSSKEVDKSSCF